MIGGVVPAIHNLANSYADGVGVTQSDANAYELYNTAIEFGDPSAMFTLGTWLYKGRHVPKDWVKSHDLQLRAGKGHGVACIHICTYNKAYKHTYTRSIMHLNTLLYNIYILF